MKMKTAEEHAIENLKFLKSKLEALVRDNFDGYNDEIMICWNINPLMLKFSGPYCMEYVIYYNVPMHRYIFDCADEFGQNPILYPNCERLYNDIKALLLDN